MLPDKAKFVVCSIISLALSFWMKHLFIGQLQKPAKGRVSIRGFLWYLNMSIIFWEQIATYRGHAPLKTLNQMGLWFCVYYVLNKGGGIDTSVLPEVIN